MRNIGLDLLRFFAVLLVVLCHLYDAPLLSARALQFVRSGGGFGVTLFFVLSGFLVSGLLFGEYDRSGRLDIRRFLLRRGFKLYPSYLALLAVRTATALPKVSSHDQWDFWLSVGIRFLFLQNYLPSMFDHTWTLAVEEHFYLLLAGVTAVLMRLYRSNPFRMIPILFFATALGVAWLRAQALGSSSANLFETQYQIDSLLFGVFLSYLCSYHDLNRRIDRIPSGLLLPAGLMVAGWLPEAVHGSVQLQGVVAHVSGYVGAGMVVLAAYRLGQSTNRALIFLAFLGSTSYSTYLWHGFVNIAARKGHEWLFGFYSPWIYMISYVAGAFAVGVFMFRIIEEPAMRLRDRWTTRGERAVPRVL